MHDYDVLTFRITEHINRLQAALTDDIVWRECKRETVEYGSCNVSASDDSAG